MAGASRVDAVVSVERVRTPAPDDDQERRVRLLLLGKGAVLAHRFERLLAAELDEERKYGVPAGTPRVRHSFRVNAAWVAALDAPWTSQGHALRARV
jgi:hypothetical protein